MNAISFTSLRIKTARLPRLETMVYHDLRHQIGRILLTSSKLLWQAPVHYKEVAGGLEPIRKGGIFKMSNKHYFKN